MEHESGAGDTVASCAMKTERACTLSLPSKRHVSSRIALLVVDLLLLAMLGIAPHGLYATEAYTGTRTPVANKSPL